MSIAPSFHAAARSAYRSLWRATASTFVGDPEMLQASRLKAREAYENGRTITDQQKYAENVKLAGEVAAFLRKNIVQGAEVEENIYCEFSATFLALSISPLRMTKATELGTNEKDDKEKTTPYTPRARTRRKETAEAQLFTSAPLSFVRPFSTESTVPPDKDLDQPLRTPHPQNSLVEKLHRQNAGGKRVIPELKEEDLIETFIRGCGPGGQAINKTSSGVSLIHKPTGIRVKLQESRSLQLNRRLARRRLVEQLDIMVNGTESAKGKKWEKERQKKRNRKKKSDKKKRQSAEDEDGEEVDATESSAQ